MYSLRRILKSFYWLFAGSPAQRRRVRQELARVSAGVFGDFPIGEDHKIWRDDHQFLADYRRLCPGNPYSQDRKWALREFVLLTNSLPGDLAECGSYEGASAYFMAQASLHGKLCLFDSFEGISSPEDRDKSHREDVLAWSAGDLRSTLERMRANLEDCQNVEIFPGWIPERFPDVAERQFRILHIDVDLYQPTRDSLEFFYPRLTDGGVIVMDDYGFHTCPGAKLAADEFAQAAGAHVLHLPTGQGVLIKPLA